MKSFNLKAHGKVLYVAPLAIASSALAVSLIAPQIASASTLTPVSTLAPVSPSRLVSWIQASHPIPLNGTVTGTTSFPIPSASLLNGLNSPSALSGSSTMSYNVWTNAAGSFRAQQMTSGGEETDLYVNPGSVWLWDSSTLTATNEQRSGSSVASPSPQSNPEVTANQIITKLGAYSTLSVSGSTKVAGRPAYTLSVTPTASDSLIGSIRIAVDGKTHVPLQIQVFSKGSTSPSASLGFATLRFAPQPASIFSFTPPAGAKVVTPTISTQSGTSGSSNTKMVGTGFDSVVVATPSAKILSGLSGIEKLLPMISTPLGVAHLYSTPIFQAIILSNGTVVGGAVTTARLLQVAADK